MSEKSVEAAAELSAKDLKEKKEKVEEKASRKERKKEVVEVELQPEGASSPGPHRRRRTELRRKKKKLPRMERRRMKGRKKVGRGREAGLEKYRLKGSESGWVQRPEAGLRATTGGLCRSFLPFPNHPFLAPQMRKKKKRMTKGPR
uniref:Parathymosin n=1 Tax=Propithecus coquereli TaxID=379532 RepID=A0A2K6FLJ1_PROCO